MRDEACSRPGSSGCGNRCPQTAKHRDLALLLTASLFYGTGISVVVFFASKLAVEYGFQQVHLVVFVGVITISGILGTIVPTLYQDRLGHRRSVVIFLLIWLVTVLGFAWYARLHQIHTLAGGGDGFPTWPLWLIGNLLGFGLGSLGSANRAFVSYLAPPNREAEVFGMWGLIWKLSAITTFPFAWVKDTVGTPQALLVLAGFLSVGLALTLFVNEPRGFAAARQPPSLPVGADVRRLILPRRSLVTSSPTLRSRSRALSHPARQQPAAPSGWPTRPDFPTLLP
ncbi:MAG: MFS transporter [Verrucomicrobia bacterium]|nr:MFS transporter [Verrucomicrobiota bacterium]